MMDGRSHSRARSCSRASSLPYFDDERMKKIMSERHMVRSWLRMSSRLSGSPRQTSLAQDTRHSTPRPGKQYTTHDG